MNGYKILSELIMSGPNPNVDMLVVRPSLYAYIANEKIKDAMQNGLSTNGDQGVKVYFTRVPETIDTYQNFVREYSPIKILIAKLKRIKDQQVRIRPVNLDGYSSSLTEDDIKKISKNNKFFTSYFERGDDISQIPHAVIWCERGLIPAFCLKILDPEKRLIGENKNADWNQFDGLFLFNHYGFNFPPALYQMYKRRLSNEKNKCVIKTKSKTTMVNTDILGKCIMNAQIISASWCLTRIHQVMSAAPEKKDLTQNSLYKMLQKMEIYYTQIINSSKEKIRRL